MSIASAIPDEPVVDVIPDLADLDLPSFRWTVCALLFLATTINYMDRQILGLLAPVLQKRIGWNEVQYGHIVIAFQASYALGLIGCGRLIDRWGTRWGYACSIVIWSLAAAAHAFAGSVFGFGLARFALGLGESGNFPAAIKTVAEWFPKRERALATGLFNCGSNAGAIIAPLIVPPIAVLWGWQAAFIAMGGMGLLWVALWLALYVRPEASSRVSPIQLQNLSADGTEPIEEGTTDIRWRSLFRYPQTWAYCLSCVCVQPVWWFYLYWLPKFFSARYDLPIAKSAHLVAVIYGMSLIGSIGGGIVPAIMIKRGHSLNFSRKATLLICVIIALPMCVVAQLDSVWAATVLIGFATSGMQAWSANAYTMVSDLFPKRAVASVIGLGSGSGSVAAIVLSEIVGTTLQRSGSYSTPFLITALVLPVAWMGIHLLAPAWEAADL